ncbi:LysR family transcriptional regulator [Brevibacterium sp. FAM 27836]|uniref:LysR family transcriptional regulator n=1 Tax=Brevibacterium sp. FAM 27836 TaxID=3446693 RepID=UPI003F518A4E
MNLEQLASFVEVAATGHFTKAAATLHLAQPSLSRQISTLEKELGAELFHRAHGHISLTAAGETLLPTARRMLADAEAIRHDMDELAGLRRGRIRLGATPTLCVSLVAEAISRFHHQHPGVELELVEKGSRELIEALGAGELDLALITRTVDLGAQTPRLQMQEVLGEDLVVIAAADGALISGDQITLAEVAALPQVLFHHGYDLREATSAAFESSGLYPNVVVEGGEMDAVLRFVERGVGVAIVPAMVLVDRPQLISAQLVEPRLSRTVSIATRADVRPTRAASAMEGTILSTARALAADDTGLAAHVRLTR